MKAINEIGLKKIILFLFFSFWELIFKCLLFSPLRIFWMKLFGGKIGKDSIVGNIRFMNLYRKGLNGLNIGKKCYIGDYVVLDLADEITLEDNVTLSEEAFILTHTNVGYKDHPLQKFIPSRVGKVKINNGCFIGIRAIVMPGVTLGEKSAVGALSLVKNDIPNFELHAGAPAKFIRKFE